MSSDSPLCNGPQRLGLNETVHLVTIDSSAVPFICDRDLYTSPDNVLKVDVRELNVQPTGCSRGAVDDTTLGIHEEETLAAVNTSGCWCNRVEVSSRSTGENSLVSADETTSSVGVNGRSITLATPLGAPFWMLSQNNCVEIVLSGSELGKNCARFQRLILPIFVWRG